MDLREAAHLVVENLLLERKGRRSDDPSDIHMAAVALGRRGGLEGGKARMDDLNDRERRQLAKKAANARWHPKGKVRHHKRKRWAKDKEPEVSRPD